jgi:hypothetical protein
MNNNFNKAAEFPAEQFTITPSNTDGIPQGPLVIYALTAGTIAAVDKNGTAVTYTVAAGDLLPILVVRVNSTGTTATCIGLR